MFSSGPHHRGNQLKTPEADTKSKAVHGPDKMLFTMKQRFDPVFYHSSAVVRASLSPVGFHLIIEQQ